MTANALTIVPNGDPSMTMSSREIAELTGKRHPDVSRDIRLMLQEIGQDVSTFAHTYLDVQNREQTQYLLPKRETLILVSGYSVQLRARIIDRWTELEARQEPATLPDFTNPADAARAWAAEYEGRVKVQAELDAA